MIQRIQTLYIIIGSLLVLCTCVFFPYGFVLDDLQVGQEVRYLINQYAGMVWLSLFSLFSSIAIFKFKNRKHQLYFLNGNIMGIIFLLLIHYVYLLIDTTYSWNWIFDIGLVLGCLFLLLAKRAIKKDEELVNSINRLR